MNSIVDRFVEKVTEVMVLDDIGIIKIRYAISAVVNEFVKFFVIVILFYMLDMLTPLLFTTLIIIPVRVTTGGLHFNNNIRCFMASLSFFILAVILLPQLEFNRSVYQAILIASGFFILIMPLAPSEKRPIISKKKYLLNRYFSFAFTLTFIGVLLFAIHDQYLVRCGIWAFALQAMQLIILSPKIISRRNHHVKENI